MVMNTTISISTKIRDQIKDFGQKGETYEDILTRLLKSAKERQLQELLMDEKNTLTVQEAMNKAKKKWHS